MANVLVDEHVLTDVADAIRLKQGSADRFYPAQMSDAILRIPQTGGISQIPPDENKEIRFFDYDGTLLHSYSLEELARLEALPEIPSREGLVCEGWNWNLDDLKTLNRRMDVGATYITDDGATRIYVELNEDNLHPYVSFGQNKNQGILVDWGDGSELQGSDGTSTATGVTIGHEYQKPGKYVVRLIPQGDTKLYILGDAYYKSKLWHANIKTEFSNTPYQENVKRIELGKQIALFGDYCFANLVRLETISMTKTIQDYNGNCFVGDVKLQYCVLPSTSNDIPYGTFKDCARLKGVSVPNGVTTLFALCFQYCRSMKNIELPDSVTRFYGGVFSNCENLERFHMPDHIQKDIGGIFAGCKGLKSYHLSNELVEIGASAFYDLFGLTTIVFPATLTKIGRVSFSKTFKNIYVKAQTPPVFEWASELDSLLYDFRIYVPVGTLEAYQAAPVWSNCVDRIIELEGL